MDELLRMMEEVSVLDSGVEYRANYRFARDKLGKTHEEAERFALAVIEEERRLDRERMMSMKGRNRARKWNEFLASKNKSLEREMGDEGMDERKRMKLILEQMETLNIN